MCSCRLSFDDGHLAATRPKPIACVRAHQRAVLLFEQTPTGPTHPADATSRNTGDESMCGHVLSDDCPCRDHRPAADGHRGNTYRTRSQGGTEVHGYADGIPVRCRLERAIRVDGPRPSVVRQDCTWPDEHTGVDDRPFVDQREVLDLHAISDDDAGADVAPSAERAFCPDRGMFANLRQVPDRRTIADGRAGGDIGRKRDRWCGQGLSLVHTTIRRDGCLPGRFPESSVDLLPRGQGHVIDQVLHRSCDQFVVAADREGQYLGLADEGDWHVRDERVDGSVVDLA